MPNLGRDPRIANTSLKTIERSAATRYFMEDYGGASLNARRTWIWGAALTNPEPASICRSVSNLPALHRPRHRLAMKHTRS